MMQDVMSEKNRTDLSYHNSSPQLWHRSNQLHCSHLLIINSTHSNSTIAIPPNQTTAQSTPINGGKKNLRFPLQHIYKYAYTGNNGQGQFKSAFQSCTAHLDKSPCNNNNKRATSCCGSALTIVLYEQFFNGNFIHSTFIVFFSLLSIICNKRQ